MASTEHEVATWCNLRPFAVNSPSVPILLELRVEGTHVRGELALVIAPGTVAKARDRLLDRALLVAITARADELGSVLAAAPASYCFVRPGKDELGRTTFDVGARIEAERLIPERPRP